MKNLVKVSFEWEYGDARGYIEGNIDLDSLNALLKKFDNLRSVADTVEIKE